jgi:hypothetical protein
MLVCGPAPLYAALLLVRGRRPLEIWILCGCALVLAAEVACALASSVQLLPGLIGMQVILATWLRRIARRRWQRIDWVTHRPVTAPYRLT